MIGFLRFILASLVVLNHLWIPTAGRMGAHAVIGFYVISGYLMTTVINKTYGLTIVGGCKYLANRFLRIYPPYWTFAAVSAVLLAIFPDTFGRTYDSIRLPDNLYDAFRNVTLIDLTWSPVRIIPPAWSLSVECFFYIAMVALLVRARLLAVTWFVGSALLTVYLVISDADFGDRYYPTYAASLFFSIGAMIYFYRGLARKVSVDPRIALAILPVFCTFPLIVEAVGADRLTVGYYGSTALFIVIFVTALDQRRDEWRRADGFLGDLAYPVFITHFMAAGIVRILFSTSVDPFGLVFLCLSYGISVAVSVIFVLTFNVTLDRVRDRVRMRDKVVNLGHSAA